MAAFHVYFVIDGSRSADADPGPRAERIAR
jgi:hypothetical protein